MTHRAISAAPSLLTELAFALGAVVVAIAYSEYRARVPVPATVAARCDPPAEFEQLHIVAVVRQTAPGQALIEAECMYVGSRGAYTREARQ